MSDYKYERPDGKLYKVSIHEWNKVFGNRGKWPLIHVELYVSGDAIISNYIYTIWAKLLVTVLYPAIVICNGCKVANQEVYSAWNQKKVGEFSSDAIYRHHIDEWEKIEKLIGKEL